MKHTALTFILLAAILTGCEKETEDIGTLLTDLEANLPATVEGNECVAEGFGGTYKVSVQCATDRGPTGSFTYESNASLESSTMAVFSNFHNTGHDLRARIGADGTCGLFDLTPVPLGNGTNVIVRDGLLSLDASSFNVMYKIGAEEDCISQFKK